MMPNPFSGNHFHPQQGHLDHKLTQCYDTSSGKQRYVELAPNDLLWVMQGDDIMDTSKHTSTHPSSTIHLTIPMSD